jgi:hypothetical protein
VFAESARNHSRAVTGFARRRWRFLELNKIARLSAQPAGKIVNIFAFAQFVDFAGAQISHLDLQKRNPAHWS